MEKVSKFISPSKIVVEVCSVMEYPVEIMKKYLPRDSQILSTHPMFGPNSINKNNNSINGLKIVLSNVSLNKEVYNLFKEYFLGLNLEVIEINPTGHDEYSAKSQFFALLIGQIAQDLNLNKTKIDTPGANAIFDALSFMGKDREIIEDMITYNRFCTQIHGQIIEILEGLKK
jgi:prephenate dehydrogenase